MLSQLINDENVIEEMRIKIIIPELYRNVESLSKAPRYWRNISNFTETLGMLSVGINIILAFSSTTFDDKNYAVYAGIAGTIGIILNQFSSFALKESKERTDEYNKILNEVLHIKGVPDLISEKDLEKGNINKD